jgi:hypothetical protein
MARHLGAGRPSRCNHRAWWLGLGLWCGLWAAQSQAASIQVLPQGLGAGVVTSSVPGINCGADCEENFLASATVNLTATPAAGSSFVRWRGDCSSFTGPVCTLTAASARRVRVEFAPSSPVAQLLDMTPEGIAQYLTDYPQVDTLAEFVAALPPEYKQNWILMTRSESLQTGTALLPRILLPSTDSRFVFSVGLGAHADYPGAHPDAVEYMQWDAATRNFRFHEIVLKPLPAMGVLPSRTREITVDDNKCTLCHTSNNIPNPGFFPGTSAAPSSLVKAKNKPNWDAYDSWGGAMPFNRDRIYKGSVEAAAFRKLLNPWTWQTNRPMAAVIEQLQLQPASAAGSDAISRRNGGINDGHILYAFDAGAVVLSEPLPTGPATAVTYSFDYLTGPAPGTNVLRDTTGVTLRHVSGGERSVVLFDQLTQRFNNQRVADELANHHVATGSVPIDVRPLALAIAKNCISRDVMGNRAVASAGTLTIDQNFFTQRHGMGLNQVYNDTLARSRSLPLRKAHLQKANLDRLADPYTATPGQGLIQTYGASTAAGTSVSIPRIRQEIFRREPGLPDATVMGGVLTDRESYGLSSEKLSLFRYFLEPLGVPVDKWSMGVRGRSRTYTFADLFGNYPNAIVARMESGSDASLLERPIPGLAPPADCSALISAVNTSLARLPAVSAVPTYTDVQRIFNRNCVECHGGLNYPPVSNYPYANFNLAENDDPALGDRLTAPYSTLEDRGWITNDPASSTLYQRVTDPSEACPGGMMPCGGPPISQADRETLRRWIQGGSPGTIGDPHVTTVNGVNYDFQSAGEFVLLKSPGFELQVRQTPVATAAPVPAHPHSGLSSCASLNTAVALSLGEHRITYQPQLNGEPTPQGLELRLDGQWLDLPAEGLNLPKGGRILRNGTGGGLIIEQPGGTQVLVTPNLWEHYQVWYLDISLRHARATAGVLGDIAPGNWLPALPDGQWLGPRPANLSSRYKVLYDTFANAWRVNDKTSLFDYAPGWSTAHYSLPQWPGFEPKSCELPQPVPGLAEMPVPEPLPLEVAKKYCASISNKERRYQCEQDVMTTGDPGFAKAYEENQRLMTNQRPTVVSLEYPKDRQEKLPTSLTLSWWPAADKDQDPLSYRLCLWPSGSPLSFNHCQVLPADTRQWTPKGLKPGQRYLWRVMAEDGKGGVSYSSLRSFTTAKG